MPAFVQNLPGRQPVLDLDAPGLRQILFVGAGLHLRRAAAVENGHVLRAEQLRLHGDIDRRHAAADHQHAAADLEFRKVLGLPQFGDVVDGIFHALGVFILEAERVDAGKADAEEHGVIVLAQLSELDSLAERLAIFDRDAADREHELHLAGGEIIHRLVGGNADTR